MELALKAFGVQIRRNLITGRADITGMPATYSTEEAVNTLPTMLADRLRVIGIKGVNRTSIVDCLTNLADKYRYNPVLDMLHTTAWDRGPPARKVQAWPSSLTQYGTQKYTKRRF